MSLCRPQSFRSLPQKPLSVDLTVEEGQRLKVIYGSLSGFHAIDVDSGTPYDLYLPTHVGDKLLSLMLQTLNTAQMTTCQHIKITMTALFMAAAALALIQVRMNLIRSSDGCN